MFYHGKLLRDSTTIVEVCFGIKCTLQFCTICCRVLQVSYIRIIVSVSIEFLHNSSSSSSQVTTQTQRIARDLRLASSLSLSCFCQPKVIEAENAAFGSEISSIFMQPCMCVNGAKLISLSDIQFFLSEVLKNHDFFF